MDRAIALLPAPMRPLFEKHRALVVQRAIDPDTWRNGGLRGGVPESLPGPRLGGLRQGSVPRAAARLHRRDGQVRARSHPRERDAAVAHRGDVRRTSGARSRAWAGAAPFGQYDVMFFSAWLAHYVSDAHQPFHAVVNYDGQLTRQWGIHTRYEAILFERFNAAADGRAQAAGARRQPARLHLRPRARGHSAGARRSWPRTWPRSATATSTTTPTTRRSSRPAGPFYERRLGRIDQRRGGDDRRRVGGRGQAAAARSSPVRNRSAGAGRKGPSPA